MKNIAIAIVSAALVVAICTFLMGLAEQYRNWEVSALVAAVAATVSIIALIVVALPLHYALSRTGKVGAVWYVVPGILVGAGFVPGLKPFGQDAVSGLILQSLWCGLLGAIGAATFWFFAVRRPRLTKQSIQTV
ncbi:hypothetical protein [Arsukibacterium sp.]|uniref:hypothetical protein n=1 Tax=Arsukibacterium sp. TaxID=1977258 RepID=UPI00299EEE67|nr:hypothetical protein [Arsukibacterium sp.]MDX1537121.1 hypothetical protein [Arsukibacterium sp.]